MKRYVLTLIVILAIALSSIVVTGSGTNERVALTPFVPTVEIMLAFSETVDVRLVATGPENDISWFVIGQFEFPGYINVNKLIIETSPGGEIRCVGRLLATDLSHAIDSTTIETFAFGVHAGVLRRIIEADGMTRFTIYGTYAHIVIDTHPSGEDVILNALPKPKERES